MEKDDYRRYFSVRAANYIVKYDNGGQESVSKKYYEFVKCKDKEINHKNHNHYQEDFFKHHGKYSMCIKNDEAILQGTKESAFYKQDHAFLVFEVEKCKDFEGK